MVSAGGWRVHRGERINGSSAWRNNERHGEGRRHPYESRLATNGSLHVQVLSHSRSGIGFAQK